MADDERDLTKFRIDPGPEPDERAALEQALARLRAAAAAPERSAWWRAGARENVAEAAGEGPP